MVVDFFRVTGAGTTAVFPTVVRKCGLLIPLENEVAYYAGLPRPASELRAQENSLTNRTWTEHEISSRYLLIQR